MIASLSIEDRIEVADRRRLLDLGQARGATSDELAQAGHVAGVLHEGQRDPIDAKAQGEIQVGAILGRESRNGNCHARSRDPLVVGEMAAAHRLGAGEIFANLGDPEEHPAVVEAEIQPRTQGAQEFAVGQLHAPARAGSRVQVEPQNVAARQGDATVLEGAEAELRSLKVGQDRQGTIGGYLGLAHRRHRRGVIFRFAVAEIEAEDVGAGARQGFDDLRRVAGRPQGGDDAGAALADHRSRA